MIAFSRARPDRTPMLLDREEEPEIEANIKALRKEYTRAAFSEDDALEDPLGQFRKWFQEALDAKISEANAVHLATSTKDGYPSGRMVLLKGFDERGFKFYTNYESRKGRELDENPRAAMTFFWKELERQARIQGSVERLTPDESYAYYKTRPRDSRIGAWASPQSRILNGRAELEKLFADQTGAFADQDEIKLPPFWGGYRLLPVRFEFWQGRANRLHDRLAYEKKEQKWIISRLAP